MRVLEVCGRIDCVTAESQQILDFCGNEPDCWIQHESDWARLDTRVRGPGRCGDCGHVATTLGAPASVPGLANARYIHR